MAVPKIRILRIIARLNIGGPAIQAVTLTGRLSDEFETRLVCGHVGSGEGDMSYLALSEGIKPEILPSLGREISPLDDLRALRDLRRIIRDFQPDIIHTHTAKAGSLGRIAGMTLKGLAGFPKRIRLIHTFHGHVFKGYFGPRKAFFFVQIERLLAMLADRIIVISPLQFVDICDRYRIADPEKVRVIPLGFDLMPFRDCRRFKKEARRKLAGCDNGDALVVGIVGRLTGIKNHRMFLDAAKVLKEGDHGLPLRFLVVGDGELRQELADYARRLGISDIVAFAGWHEDMPRVYGAMDAVALTSFNEGTPVTLIEAMAAGIPVAATSVGGIPDLMGEIKGEMSGCRMAERGILVRPDDPASLADAVLFLLKSTAASERMTARSKEYVLSRYSMERLLSDMKQLYSEVLLDP
jgi:glycosyltransferase involved in cell wall biosynthesis